MCKERLPHKFIVKMDESKVPKKILPILRKGIHYRKHPYCVAFSLMQGECYRGAWGDGSVRFLHCVCKMIDDGTPIWGTTPLTGIRALKGWGTCDEDLWPSNVDLSVPEFEDYRNIPEVAWDDARRKRIQRNKALVASCPSTILDNGGRTFRLFTFTPYLGRLGGGGDKQLDLTVIDEGFETVAWAQLRAEVQNKRIVLEDLFVKPELRGKVCLGTRLLHRIERISCLEPVFCGLSDELLAPIPIPDAGLTRYVVTRDFFQKNGYLWRSRDPIRGGQSYSMFTAVKKLNCAEIGEIREGYPY